MDFNNNANYNIYINILNLIIYTHTLTHMVRPTRAYRYPDTQILDTHTHRLASYFWAGGKIPCFDKVRGLDVVSKHEPFLWLSTCWNTSPVN